MLLGLELPRRMYRDLSLPLCGNSNFSLTVFLYVTHLKCHAHLSSNPINNLTRLYSTTLELSKLLSVHTFTHQSTNLNESHTHTHTLQCPFDGCLWRFATPYKLRRHIKSHTKETPYLVSPVVTQSSIVASPISTWKVYSLTERVC